MLKLGISIPEPREQLANDPGCCKNLEAVHARLGSSNEEFTAGRVRSMQVANQSSRKPRARGIRQIQLAESLFPTFIPNYTNLPWVIYFVRWHMLGDEASSEVGN